MTKYDLRQYQSLKKEIARLQQQISDIDKLLAACADSERVYHKQYERRITKLKEVLGRAERQYEAIEDAIATLPSEERMLIRYRYVDGWTWERIADEYHYTSRNVHYIHSNALKRLKDIEKPCGDFNT